MILYVRVMWEEAFLLGILQSDIAWNTKYYARFFSNMLSAIIAQNTTENPAFTVKSDLKVYCWWVVVDDLGMKLSNQLFYTL